MADTKLISMIKYADRHKERLFLTAVLFLLPLICALAACALEGKSIGDVYLPASYWNDELFYYKQVEAMVSHGVPQGFFGFNESRGMYLSFAAWSPVLLLVWTLWGKLFGWTLVSPIYCNIVCMMLGMAVFSLTARPDKRQALQIGTLFILFTPVTRHMLSGMPEAVCYSLLIMFMGTAMAYVRERRKKFLLWMFVLSGVLTLMRPYLLLFMLLPAYYWIQRNKKAGIPGSLAVLGSVFAGYCAIHYFLGAAYLTKLFDVSFLTNFFTEGFGGGIRYLTDRTAEEVKKLIYFVKEAVKHGHFAGSLYMAVGMQGIVLVWEICGQLWGRKKRKRKSGNRKEKSGIQLVLPVHMCLIMIVMMLAVLWMYKLGEGSKHMASFIVAALALIGMLKSKYGVKQWIIAVTFLYFFVIKAAAPYDYQVPYDDGVISQEVADLQTQLAESMELTEGISYDNTIIWLSYDMIGGEPVSEQWQMLYALPQGYGINLCLYDYTMENLKTLQSRYLAAIPGGKVEKKLLKRGAELMGRNSYVAVYDISNIKDKK